MHTDFELWHQKINSPLSPMLQWPHFCHYLIPLSLAGRLKSFSTHKRWQKGRDCNFQRILASECHYGRRLNRWTHSNRRVQPKSSGEDVEWGLRGLLRLYWVPACFACLLLHQKFWHWNQPVQLCTMYIYVPLCTTMASNMGCTWRSKPGGCACGISLTSASTRVPRKGQSTRVLAGLGYPRKGQGAGPRKIYGKPTEGGILAPPPPQFQPARPNFFPSHLQHFHGAGHV